MRKIYVSNLPIDVTEDRLREFFSQKGEITSVNVMHLRNGKRLQTGYIEFRAEHEAEEAVKYFNGSDLDTHRITCFVVPREPQKALPKVRGRNFMASLKATQECCLPTPSFEIPTPSNPQPNEN